MLQKSIGALMMVFSLSMSNIQGSILQSNEALDFRGEYTGFCNEAHNVISKIDLVISQDDSWVTLKFTKEGVVTKENYEIGELQHDVVSKSDYITSSLQHANWDKNKKALVITKYKTFANRIVCDISMSEYENTLFFKDSELIYISKYITYHDDRKLDSTMICSYKKKL